MADEAQSKCLFYMDDNIYINKHLLCASSAIVPSDLLKTRRLMGCVCVCVYIYIDFAKQSPYRTTHAMLVGKLYILLWHLSARVQSTSCACMGKIVASRRSILIQFACHGEFYQKNWKNWVSTRIIV